MKFPDRTRLSALLLAHPLPVSWVQAAASSLFADTTVSFPVFVFFFARCWRRGWEEVDADETAKPGVFNLELKHNENQ